MLCFVPCVIYGENRVPRHFLLYAEQPICGVRVLGVLRKGVYVLGPRRQWWIGRGVGNRKGWVRKDGLKDIYVVTRKRRYVGDQSETELHRHEEYSAIAVDHSFSLAKWIPGKTDAGRKISFRHVVSLAGGKKRLGGNIKILEAAVALRPGGVVLIPKRDVKGESARNLPVVLRVKIPVGISDAHKAGESKFRQDKGIIVFKVRKTAEIVGLLRTQPFI